MQFQIKMPVRFIYFLGGRTYKNLQKFIWKRKYTRIAKKIWKQKINEMGLSITYIKINYSPAGVARWIKRHPMDQEVLNSIPSQGICLGFGLDSQ